MLELKKAVIIPSSIDDWNETDYKNFKQVKEMFKVSELISEVVISKKYVFVIKKREILIYRKEKQ